MLVGPTNPCPKKISCLQPSPKTSPASQLSPSTPRGRLPRLLRGARDAGHRPPCPHRGGWRWASLRGVVEASGGRASWTSQSLEDVAEAGGGRASGGRRGRDSDNIRWTSLGDKLTDPFVLCFTFLCLAPPPGTPSLPAPFLLGVEEDQSFPHVPVVLPAPFRRE
jgi:hypothetical protein